jgi:hypothetical protein
VAIGVNKMLTSQDPIVASFISFVFPLFGSPTSSLNAGVEAHCFTSG